MIWNRLSKINSSPQWDNELCFFLYQAKELWEAEKLDISWVKSGSWHKDIIKKFTTYKQQSIKYYEIQYIYLYI